MNQMPHLARPALETVSATDWGAAVAWPLPWSDEEVAGRMGLTIGQMLGGQFLVERNDRGRCRARLVRMARRATTPRAVPVRWQGHVGKSIAPTRCDRTAGTRRRTTCADGNGAGQAWAKNGPRMGHKAQKRRSPHEAGFVSACQHSYFLVAGARFELATFGL